MTRQGDTIGGSIRIQPRRVGSLESQIFIPLTNEVIRLYESFV